MTGTLLEQGSMQLHSWIQTIPKAASALHQPAKAQEPHLHSTVHAQAGLGRRRHASLAAGGIRHHHRLGAQLSRWHRLQQRRPLRAGGSQSSLGRHRQPSVTHTIKQTTSSSLLHDMRNTDQWSGKHESSGSGLQTASPYLRSAVLA